METFDLGALLADCGSKEAPNFDAPVNETSPELLLAALVYAYVRLN